MYIANEEKRGPSYSLRSPQIPRTFLATLMIMVDFLTTPKYAILTILLQ
jgi:hypothetical protein